MGEVLRTGKPVRDREVIIERPDGSRISALANIDPLFDPSGTLIGGVNCFQDISELKRAQSMLIENERRSRELLQALPVAVYTTDPEGRITFYNDAAIRLWGVEPELGTSQWCGSWKLYQLDGTSLPHDQCPMAQALKTGIPIRGAEAVAERPDGSRVPFIPYPTPLHDSSGNMVGAVNMMIDITERKCAEKQQKALLDELNHRVKNTLATVQSLAAPTLRGAALPAELRHSFEERLLALSKTHDQLSRRGWESADLAAMVADLFAPYRADGGRERLLIEGEPVKLPPHSALTLAMVLHELATNAAKYGSLSAPEGRLALSWDVRDDARSPQLEIAWRESGGPAVRAPERRGFGSRLLERGITQELKGSAELEFAPAGVRCRLRIPVSADGA